MKFSTSAAALALLSAASSVNAIGTLGFDLGVKRNTDAQCKDTSDYLSDFSGIEPYSSLIRVYAASDCNTLEYLAPALLEKTSFKAILGIWPNDDDHFALEKTALSTYLPTISVSSVYAFTVGSEALYRADLTADELAAKITEIKSFVADIEDKDGNSYGSIPVGFADSWDIIVDGANAAPIKASDIVLSNAFSYWQGQTQANASYSFFDDIMQSLQAVQTISSDIEFWIGETGWATAGADYGSAVPSVSNAASFWQEGICAIRAWGINTLVFEAYDESWKPDTTGDNGVSISGVEKNWGVLNDDGTPKYELTCSF